MIDDQEFAKYTSNRVNFHMAINGSPGQEVFRGLLAKQI
jgi:hypothetical protein